MQNNTNFPPTLLHRLQSHAQNGPLPMHMPGHKRNTRLFPELEALGARLDITEIHGFDDLHDAQGILAQSMETAAALWGSQKTFYLVGGSTAGILSGIRAAARPGDKVLAARNCHKSVYHALELCGLNPVFLLPPLCPDTGICASIQPEQVEAALRAHPDVRLLILTSPTYEGVVSDIKSICALAHARNIPVLVDEAHGAHLGFTPFFPDSAVHCGADLVIQSLHKTMPCLTQTALLHVCTGRVSSDTAARQLDVFETSSPSYLLKASIDSCIQRLRTCPDTIFSHWEEALHELYARMTALKRLQLWNAAPGVFARDPSKLVISTAQAGLSGPALMELLRTEYDIECEMAAADYVIAMTGPGDTADSLMRFADALLSIDRGLKPGPAHSAFAAPALTLPRRRLPPETACTLPCVYRPFRECAGKTSAAYIWAYPPGIPLVLPGEIFSDALLDSLQGLEASGISLKHSRPAVPGQLAVLEKQPE